MSNNFSYLIDVYKETLNDEKTFINSRSIHWEKCYKLNDKFFDLNNLINFRKKKILSYGLDDAEQLQNKLNFIEVLDDFDGDFLKKNLPEKNIGNCQFSINFLGYYFDYGIIHHLKWYQKIEKYIQNNDYILEIGGGFGSLARIILNNKNVKYFLIDLPEANLMSNYYLQNHFPEKKIFNYINFKKYKLEDELNNFDIFILPPNTLNKKNINFDFVINTRSFMEMTKNIISEYFNLIHKKLKQNGYFLNINRYMKDTVGEEIKFEEYPYDDFWNIEISEKSYLQNHIHFMLTKRINSKGNIKDELINLKKNNFEWTRNWPLRRRLKLMKYYVKRFSWLFIIKILTLIFKKKSLKRISKVIYNMSEN